MLDLGLSMEGFFSEEEYFVSLTVLQPELSNNWSVDVSVDAHNLTFLFNLLTDGLLTLDFLFDIVSTSVGAET